MLRDCTELNFTVIEEENGSDFENFSESGMNHTSEEKFPIDESIFPSRTVKVNSVRSLNTTKFAAMLLCIAAFPLESRNATTTYRSEGSYPTDSLQTLRYEVNNHESELAGLAERFSACEDLLQQMRADINVLRSSASSDKRNMTTNRLEDGMAGFVSDLRTIREYSEKLAGSLAQAENKIEQLENSSTAQSKNLQYLQQTIASLMQALGADVPESQNLSADGIYVVQNGDSLSKIAVRFKTTVSKLRQDNGLKNSVIRVGQKLKISS